jgi:hypothetical protein
MPTLFLKMHCSYSVLSVWNPFNRKDAQEKGLVMPGKKAKLTPAEQRKRFIETARELGIPDTEAAQEKAFGKVGLKKPKKTKRKK